MKYTAVYPRNELLVYCQSLLAPRHNVIVLAFTLASLLSQVNSGREGAEAATHGPGRGNAQ